MKKYILRLDDACEKMDIIKWNRIESILDKFSIKPLVGVIPHCEDPMMDNYSFDNCFWEKVSNWAQKGWTIALHGYNHVYSTNCGGINPIHNRSEFAGEPLEIQKKKIRDGVSIFRAHGYNPTVFFAPSHTFDNNTLIAISVESDIRIISDTISFDAYRQGIFTYVPQQSGKVRNLPFRTCTFCYHPNSMKEEDFTYLERFLAKNNRFFSCFPTSGTNRKRTVLDKILNYFYLIKHR